jgi:hypothetical protein
MKHATCYFVGEVVEEKSCVAIRQHPEVEEKTAPRAVGQVITVMHFG